MSKKILILGGGQAQIGLIKTAKSIGLDVIIAGIEGNYPGYVLADKIYYNDIFDKEAILEIALKEKIDGISMVCSDFGLETVGYVCDKMHLKGITEKSALDSSNKYKMKNLLLKEGVNTAKFKIVKNKEDVKKIKEELKFPLISKAVDLQGSRGIYISRNEDELELNYQQSINDSKLDFCIVEEFIEGDEFGAQAFVVDNEILFVEPHGDILWKGEKNNVPIGHYMPFLSNNKIKNQEIKQLAIKAIKALGFNDCAVNIDMIMKNGTPHIIELTARAGANFLPELTSYYLGFNYYELILRCALNDNPKDYFNNRKKGANCVLSRQLYTLNQGKIKDITVIPDSNIKISELFVKQGDFIEGFHNSNDCIGKVLCTGDTIEKCQSIMQAYINNNIKITWF